MVVVEFHLSRVAHRDKGFCEGHNYPQIQQSVTPLTEHEQRAIASRFTELQLAIEQGRPGVARKHEALRKVYRGRSRTFLHSFASARDRRHWTWQMEQYLFAEIEPRFWPTEDH